MSTSSPGATDETKNTEHSVVPEQHGQAEQDALPDLVAPQGVNEGSGREDPAPAGDTTGAQRSYLETLAREAGEQLPADLTKAQASEHIDRLQARTGRGQ